MLFMGEEQDIKHKVATNTTKGATENNVFILYFPCKHSKKYVLTK